MVKAKSNKKKPTHIAKVKDSQDTSNTIESTIAIGDFDSLDFLAPLLSYISSSADDSKLLIICNSHEKIVKTRMHIKAIKLSKHLQLVSLQRGGNPSAESEILEKPFQILLTSLSKLNYHAKHTAKHLNLQDFHWILIDQINTIFDSEKSSSLAKILQGLPQSKIIQVTATKNCPELSEFATAYIPNAKILTREISTENILIEHKFVKVEYNKKFLLLYTFIFRNQSRKIFVVFNSSYEVKFFKKLLGKLEIKTLSAHSLKSGEKNHSAISELRSSKTGVMLATEEAIKGDINCDYLIEYDIQNIGAYLRLGLKECRAIFFVNTGEELEKFEEKGLKFTEMVFSNNKLLNIQPKVEKFVETDYKLHRLAREAYRNYILAGYTKEYKNVALSFGLTNPPRVNNLDS